MSEFARDGRLWLRHALSEAEIGHLGRFADTGDAPGVRVALEGGLASALLATGVTGRICETWPGMQPVRAVLFDKSDASNWGLPWHQDRVIALRDREDVPGFRNWTQKRNVWHCEPPLSLLEKMLFVRIHLDACSEETGAMEIALGSHGHGLIAAEQAEGVASDCPTEVTEARAGDVLILSMLLLHRSRPAIRPARRRVLRVDYCAEMLPPALEWAA